MDDFQLQAKKLNDAALEGNVLSLLNLLKQDPLILDRYGPDNNSSNFIPSPLHVAVNNGHLDFTREILSRKSDLTEEVDQIRRWSALHIASRKGYLEIVKVLISVNPNMCFARDVDGLNPVHIAAVNGQVHVLEEVIKFVSHVSRERTNDGATVLHLCVKYCQIDALKKLVNLIDDVELLNFKDCDGNTILHLAVATKQPEMVKFLVTNKKMEKNAINSIGLTAMDILNRSKKSINDSEIWVPLKRAKALKAKKVLKPRNKNKNWLKDQRKTLMIVASLIATMAFQVGINPPGGAWQDNLDGHKAGNSVMADVAKDQYDSLLIYNTVGLISSLSVILLLISGLPCKRLFVGVLMITSWVAVTATALTYVVSVSYLVGYKNVFPSTSKDHHEVWVALEISIGVWVILMALLLLGHAVRFVVKCMRGLVRLAVRLFKGCLSIVSTHSY